MRQFLPSVVNSVLVRDLPQTSTINSTWETISYGFKRKHMNTHLCTCTRARTPPTHTHQYTEEHLCAYTYTYYNMHMHTQGDSIKLESNKANSIWVQDFRYCHCKCDPTGGQAKARHGIQRTSLSVCAFTTILNSVILMANRTDQYLLKILSLLMCFGAFPPACL